MAENIIININNAVDIYDHYKRKIKGKNLTLCYDVCKNEFRELKENESANENTILFLNPYETCLKIIDLYLNQKAILQYRDACIEKMKESKDQVVACLWFFDSIDGAYDFERFEYEQIVRIISRWCKKLGYEYSWDPNRFDTFTTWLTEERMKAGAHTQKNGSKKTKFGKSGETRQ